MCDRQVSRSSAHLSIPGIDRSAEPQLVPLDGRDACNESEELHDRCARDGWRVTGDSFHMNSKVGQVGYANRLPMDGTIDEMETKQ
jgi:hypothetical protein